MLQRHLAANNGPPHVGLFLSGHRLVFAWLAVVPGSLDGSLANIYLLSPSSLDVLLIIRLEARLQLNIGFTFRRVLAVFTRSA